MKLASIKKTFAVCLVLACVLIIVGCRVKIGNILAEPDKYRDKQVTVFGEVTRKLPIPFLETAGYVLKDETGEMWVLTRRTLLPEVGQRVKVTGVIEAGVRVGSRDFGLVLSEQKREPI
ncbi:hypothetical protein J7M28_02675 [bacterium]|nr:hypothetical protein [bacterium]